MGSKIFATAAVAAMLAFLFWPRDPDLRHDVSSDVQTCKRHMMAIHKGLVSQERAGTLDMSSGYAMLGGLIDKGTWKKTAENIRMLTCTGPGAHAMPDDAFASPGSFDATSTAYAFRNLADHPLSKFPAGGEDNEPILACDNASGMNHAGVMNVLYTDGSILTLHIEQEIERKRLPPGTTTIAVGTNSPIEALKKLQ